ncbi:unnamed protein product [Boreogadus saida]
MLAFQLLLTTTIAGPHDALISEMCSSRTGPTTSVGPVQPGQTLQSVAADPARPSLTPSPVSRLVPARANTRAFDLG